jgi:predicted permease
MVSNSLTFALGPRLLRPGDEDSSDAENDADSGDESRGSDSEEEQEQSQGDENRDLIDEETSLLPQHQVRKANWVGQKAYNGGRARLERLPSWAHNSLGIAYEFLNAPLIGAAVGAFIGLIPPLHRLFFNEISEGGYLKAWLTSSIKNIGDLFASLQIIVVGVKLSQSLRNMKRGEDSGPFSWKGFTFITFVRFLIWPA